MGKTKSDQNPFSNEKYEITQSKFNQFDQYMGCGGSDGGGVWLSIIIKKIFVAKFISVVKNLKTNIPNIRK